MELRGDSAGALELLRDTVRQQPQNVENLALYAEFLDRRGDVKAREAYADLLSKLDGDQRKKAELTRRVIILDLIAGDNQAAARHLEIYRGAGGSGLDASAIRPRIESTPAAAEHYIEIPGPLVSFSRMAAISRELEVENVLPAVARNVVTNGYQASASYEGLQPTEYLKLVIRYLSQARELEKLADDTKTIRIETCESPQTADLLRVLGYRMRGACGSDVILETVNATRAFLTIDSAFPLASLEQALRTNRPFSYDYKPSRIPILYGEDYWLAGQDKRRREPFINAFLGDPALCRLYLGLSKLDSQTAGELRKAADMPRLKAFAHVLDFFGAFFEVRSGKAVVPGGERSAATWAKLVGVSPAQGGEFFLRLIAKDDGWMASYFDCLLRTGGPARDYLTEPARLERFYGAVRGRVTSPGPARPVFRSNADLMLLTTRLRLEPNGQPHIPGNLGIWKNLFIQYPDKEYDQRLRVQAPNWKDADDLLEALFALCRKPVGNEPLKIYLALSDANRRRTTPLEPATVDRLARSFKAMGAQYTIFTETDAISDKTILAYLDRAAQINEIGNRLLRSDVAGSMQALVGLWQIFVRNGSIPASEGDAALSAILEKFGNLKDHQELYESATAGVQVILKATHAPENLSAHDRLIDLLVGASKTEDQETQQAMIQELISLFEAQKLVQVDLIFDLENHLEAVAASKEQLNTALVNRLATRLDEVRLPYEGLSSVEKSSISFGYWAERHIQAQRRFQLRTDLQKAINNAEKVRYVKGVLAQILRDTLVGYNYIHYAPPGAQILRTNSVFVRGHDFVGMPGSQQTWQITEVFGTGWPSNAGGRLVGSLSGLPYALAEAEQNFLIPEREQALIWSDLVPQMILNAKIPRWWNVTPAQMHWLALHVRYGESAVAEAALDKERLKQVLEHLEHQATPTRVKRVEELLQAGDVKGAIDSLTPSELFILGTELLATQQDSNLLAREIRRLASEHSDQINREAISRAFGSPKPTLATSYRPELLHFRTFPTLMGYSSRIMAETWESNALYYATLADELYIRPTQLNLLVPQWTQKTVEKIFATHLEDWPAVLRSLRKVGEDIRTEMRQRSAAEQASLQPLQ
jgi:hypothetical protein